MLYLKYDQETRSTNLLQQRNENTLLWISKSYCIYQEKEIELLESPLGTNETISQVVNDIDAGYYKDCLALWYSVEDKRITLAFANRKEGGNQ